MDRRDDNKSRFSVPGKGLLIAGGLLAGFLIARFFIIPYTVQNNSMLPALASGNTVLILKTSTAKRGDIVLIKSPVQDSKVMIKRIIAVEHETIEIRNRAIFINNKFFTPNWKIIESKGKILPMSFTGRDNMPTVKIKNNQYFVTGDNSDESYDSREFGVIGKNLIIGTLLYKY